MGPKSGRWRPVVIDALPVFSPAVPSEVINAPIISSTTVVERSGVVTTTTIIDLPNVENFYLTEDGHFVDDRNVRAQWDAGNEVPLRIGRATDYEPLAGPAEPLSIDESAAEREKVQRGLTFAGWRARLIPKEFIEDAKGDLEEAISQGLAGIALDAEIESWRLVLARLAIKWALRTLSSWIHRLR
jgi:hypothetical protein